MKNKNRKFANNPIDAALFQPIYDEQAEVVKGGFPPAPPNPPGLPGIFGRIGRVVTLTNICNSSSNPGSADSVAKHSMAIRE